MNTPSNKVKAQFFALYWNQEVLKYEDSEGDPFWDKQIYPVDGHNITCKGLQLNLRSIDQLTDEEVILCGQIGFVFFHCIECEYKLKVIRELNKISLAAVSLDEKTCLVKIEINNEWKLIITQIDYLRSIGILLPFTYLSEDNKPITLSPSDLIGFGWVKMEKEV